MTDRFPGFLPAILICLFASLGDLAVALPKDLADAQEKYIESATARLGKASGDADAREKLAALNVSFLKHLEKLHPKILAVSPEGGAEVEVRILLMKRKLASTLPLATLDARDELKQMTGSATPDGAPEPPRIGEDEITGELSCREEGKRVKVGETFEIKGRTKGVPDGYVVSVFGGKTTAGLFPRENRKDPNRRFVVRGMSSETWLGSVEFLLMIVPEETMTEIEDWYQLRVRWATAGFPAGETPTFRGKPAGNLFRKDYIEAGARVLAEVGMEFAR